MGSNEASDERETSGARQAPGASDRSATPDVPLQDAGPDAAPPPGHHAIQDLGTATAASGAMTPTSPSPVTGIAPLHCPHCGSTDISQDSNGLWHCAFCRGTFQAANPAMVVLSSTDAQRAQKDVIDTADLFSEADEQTLRTKLEQLDDWYGVEIVVETVNTITENVDYYARSRAQELGVGSDATDNGIYILVVAQPHHVQVEVGNGIAPYVRHADIQDVVQSTMIPAFRGGDYVTGLTQGATQIAYRYRSGSRSRPSGLRDSIAGSPAAPSAGRRFGKALGWLVVAIVVLTMFGGGGAGLLGMLMGGIGGMTGSVIDGGSGYDSGYDSGWGDSGGGYSDFGSDFGGGDFDTGSSGGGDW